MFNKGHNSRKRHNFDKNEENGLFFHKVSIYMKLQNFMHGSNVQVTGGTKMRDGRTDTPKLICQVQP